MDKDKENGPMQKYKPAFGVDYIPNPNMSNSKSVALFRRENLVK